jgi:hypothetical protein
MLIWAALLVTVASAAPSGGRLDAAEWVLRSGKPSTSERRCTDYSLLFWSVSLAHGDVQTKPLTTRERLDPIPFSYAKGQDRQGNRHVERVGDGWLVGFDAGEFGGGLWWFSDRGGHESRRIRPDPSSPANPDDVFHAENVLGLPVVGSEQLVLMGLDHLTGRSGRIFRAVLTARGWMLAPVAVLDAEPAVWLVDGSRLLFLTESGLWESDGLSARRVHAIDLGGFAPTSLVRSADGALYVGMRYYLLRLVEGSGGWAESWFVPASCQKVRLREYTCVCVQWGAVEQGDEAGWSTLELRNSSPVLGVEVKLFGGARVGAQDKTHESQRRESHCCHREGGATE